MVVLKQVKRPNRDFKKKKKYMIVSGWLKE